MLTNLMDVVPVPLTFMKMGEDEPCPGGTEITTEEECEAALTQATQFEIYPVRKSVVSGSWSGLPPGCSYQHAGDGAFHYNTRATGNQNNYRMICKRIGNY